MDEWSEIREYVCQPKFRELCRNIAAKDKQLSLLDDFYQELILCLLEKIETRTPSILNAWTKKYIDWYIVTIADRMFRGKWTVMAKYRGKHYSYDTAELSQQVQTEIDTDVKQFENDWEAKVKAVEKELEGQYWYNKELFKMYVYNDESIRSIEQKTRIKRSSIHATLRRTKEEIKSKVEGNWNSNHS